jgi:hypothetical protein
MEMFSNLLGRDNVCYFDVHTYMNVKYKNVDCKDEDDSLFNIGTSVSR